METDALIRGLQWFVVFLLSTTLHEAAHALVALRGGDPTAYLGGQVSLSPVPHIRREPLGMLVVPLLMTVLNGWAVGWASTPYDPLWASRHPRRAASMAAATADAAPVLARTTTRAPFERTSRTSVVMAGRAMGGGCA